jgi:PAS domain S-box-containing protein
MKRLALPVEPSITEGPRTGASAGEGWYEKLYHMLLGNIPFSLLLIDPSLRVVSANRNFLEKAKRSEANTIGKRFREVFPDAILEFTRLEAKIRGVFESGAGLPGATMSYRAPGVPIRSYFYTVIPIKTGRTVEHAMVVMDDITEKLQLSAKVRMAERHLASVVESANDLVISTDAMGCVTSWNSAAERISGYASSSVRGRLLAGLCEFNRSKDMAAIIDQMVTGGVIEFFSEINLLSAAGALIPVDWSFSPIRDDSGQVSGIVAVGRDLVERRALEQHLYQSEKLAALGVMAGGIAHELRNPLSVSYSAAQFLLDPIDDPAFQKECVGKILQGIERSSMIIENLLRFARPPSSNQAESLNLVTVVRETLSVLTPQAKVQKINLIEHYAETVLPISGNANLLQQVIMNLVLNAYQALPGGGDVSVFTRSEGDQAAVYVRDTGCGIALAHLSQIFDPFFTTRPVGQGTGLGLSICHTIVKQHGGVIAVENSVEGQGSTLVVRLPMMVSVR